MKKIYLIIILFFFQNYIQSQTIVNWGTPLPVATGLSNVYPRLTLINGENPLVIWENASTDKIYSSKWTGTAFTTPLILNPPGVIPYIATWVGAEIGSSGDTAFVVFFSEPMMSAKIYIVRSIDGGLSFSDTLRIDSAGTSTIPAFPTVAVAPGGNPVVSYMQTNSSMLDAEYVLLRSTDGGNNFGPPVTPSLGAPGFVCDCCPASIAIDGNNQSLLYRNDDTNIRDIWASFSSDASATFPFTSEIDQTNWYITSCPSSGPSGLIIGDSLFYTWMSDATSDARIYMGSTNIHDQQIGQNRQLYPFGSSTQNFPVIAGKGDTLGVVWQGYNAGSQEVLFTYSVTGAAGLGQSVDTLTKGLPGNQSRPDIEFKNGKFHVVYSDSNGGNVKYLTGNISAATGIEESSGKALLVTSFYQNGSIVLKLNSEMRNSGICEVYNSLGQKVASSGIEITQGKNDHVISGDFKSGIYMISISTNNGQVYRSKMRIIK
jgi:hypothetical protein